MILKPTLFLLQVNSKSQVAPMGLAVCRCHFFYKQVAQMGLVA